MRLIIDVDEAGEAGPALAALLFALKRRGTDPNDWSRVPGNVAGVTYDGEDYSIRTTRTGWSVRRNIK